MAKSWVKQGRFGTFSFFPQFYRDFEPKNGPNLGKIGSIWHILSVSLVFIGNSLETAQNTAFGHKFPLISPFNRNFVKTPNNGVGVS